MEVKKPKETNNDKRKRDKGDVIYNLRGSREKKYSK